MEIPEFTCLCPKTGQPDFATLYLDYVPDRKCVELKSLKLYVWSYRNQGAFHEAVTNRILDDLAKRHAAAIMRLTRSFYVRGGIFTTVVAETRKKGWQPRPRGQFDASRRRNSARVSARRSLRRTASRWPSRSGQQSGADYHRATAPFP